jgi:hypothetical protein
MRIRKTPIFHSYFLPKLVAVTAFGILFPACAQSQSTKPIQLGFKGGVPLFENDFSTHTGVNRGFDSAVRRWMVGATAETHLWGPLNIEVDALYRRVGFDFNTTGAGGAGVLTQSSVANWWEFPVLFKTKVPHVPYSPFVDFGASLRHISSIRQTSYPGDGGLPRSITDNSSFIKNRNSPGAVAGVGIDLQYKYFKLSPEVRYTRWFNQAFQDSLGGQLKTNLDELNFLVGLTF